MFDDFHPIIYQELRFQAREDTQPPVITYMYKSEVNFVSTCHDTWKNRFKAAWLVFTGKADAIIRKTT